MATFLFLMVLGCGGYKLCKAGPKMLRFAAENADMCMTGGSMLKRMFRR
jgi:hypothetical protein